MEVVVEEEHLGLREVEEDQRMLQQDGQHLLRADRGTEPSPRTRFVDNCCNLPCCLYVCVSLLCG
jgi:hypothetical protein